MHPSRVQVDGFANIKFKSSSSSTQQAVSIPVHSRSTKRGPPQQAENESEKGVALAPSAKDLNPWYSTRTSERGAEREQAAAHSHQQQRPDDGDDDHERRKRYAASQLRLSSLYS